MGEARTFSVPAGAAGERLDSWLAVQLEDSRTSVVRMINDGLVTIGEGTPARSMRLTGGEVVSVASLDSVPADLAAAPAARVEYEDDDLLVVDKPAGLVVHPAAGHRGETLTEQLERDGKGVWKPLLVHRLDRDTSGLMLVAKDEGTQAFLQEALRRREVERHYVALVSGHPASRTGVIDAPIGRDRRNRTRMSVDTDKPREAVTHFVVAEQFEHSALLDLTLETGRTHQIRAHLAAIGLPVYGDVHYGGERVQGLDRQFLHSSRLRFPMPHTRRVVTFESSLPGDLAEVLSALQSR